MITLAVIGILAAVLLPIVQKAQPDKLEAMRRKSYYILEQTVSQMYDDESMYRKLQNPEKQGFRNTERIKLETREYEGKTKFCELFSHSLTKRLNQRVICKKNEKTFTSADNVDWYLPVTDFSSGYAEIKFDVNGKSGPNCEYDAESCQHPDTFKYYVNAYGKLMESEPQAKTKSYCIRTKITGNGTVKPSSNYCGLANGTYLLTSEPAEGWQSNWPNNEKSITINGSDVETSVAFTESVKSCIRLNVNCKNSAELCGTYSLSGGSFIQTGQLYESCNLLPGTYTVTVTPKTNYLSNWTNKQVSLNGLDQTLSVSLSEQTYCAKLNVDCPAGSANLCGSYVINGNKAMNASADYAQLCSLPSGSYDLLISSVKVGDDDKYKVNPEHIGFSITNSDWEGNAAFEEIIHTCEEKGYFEANGKKWSCPFLPTPITESECLAKMDTLGITNCYTSSWRRDNNYWAGAVKQCGGVNKMPTYEDLAAIVYLMFDIKYEFKLWGNTDVVYKQNASTYGFPEPPFRIWTGELDDRGSLYQNCILYRWYEMNYTGYTACQTSESTTTYAICRID